MPAFNYAASAELFPSRRFAKSATSRYRRFDTAAEAIRYVVEEMSAKSIPGSYLQVGDHRLEGDAIRALYDAAAFPLERKLVAA